MHFTCKGNFLKKIIFVLFLFCFFIFSLTGCLGFSQDWVKKIGDEKISFSNFLLLTTLKINEVESDIKISTKNFDELNFEEFKEAEIKGTPAVEYLKNKVGQEIKKNLVNIMAAKKLNIKYSQKELKSLQKQAYDHYKYFNENFKAYKIGISLKDCEEFVMVSNLEKKIPQELFGKGKSKEIKKERLVNYAKDKSKVLAYTTLTIPKSLEKERFYDEEQKKYTDELVLKKYFGVERLRDLVDKFSKEKKSLQEIEKEFVEVLKKQDVKVKGNAEFLEEEKEDFKSGEDEKKEKQELIKALKEDNDDTPFKVLRKMDGSMQLVKTINLKDEETEPLQEKIKGILESQEKKQYIKSVEKEFASKIETNEESFNNSAVEKQVKKYYKNKTAKQSFSIF